MAYIKGIYSKEIYRNEINGYTVGIVNIKETDILEIEKINTISFVGTFADLRLKNGYMLNGNLIEHSKYGLQFEVSSYEILMPSKKEELIEFLSSDLFPITEKMASKIVDKFGSDTLEIILNSPNDLLMIPRLSQTKIDKIYNILQDYQYTSSIVIKLGEMGFSTKKALNLLNKYKTKTLDIIKDNIYDLIEKDDFNFVEIDNIALNNGIKVDDEKRINALIIYAMKQLCFEKGDTYLNFDEILKKVEEFLDISSSNLEANIIKLNKMGKIVIIDNKYYLREFYEAENYIASRLCFLNDMSISKYPNLEKKIDNIEKDNNIKYDDIQKKAIIKAVSNNITIITGGPGTGKTTIIKAIVSLLINELKVKKEDIALLAPTGRAAKKMMETTNLVACTIHKYLGWDKESNTFKVDAYNSNSEHYIIVDEVSMIDTLVFKSLFEGTKRDAKFILVGDYYQLPSVREGQVLKDLIDSNMFDVISLNQIYRQIDSSYIVNLAYEVKNKDLSENFMSKKDDYNFVLCTADQINSSLVQVITKAMAKGYTKKDIQVLAPMYKGINGIDNLNKILQEIFNPKNNKKNEYTYGEVVYRIGDKILQLINDPDNNVYNGDIGYIYDISKTKEKIEIIIDFDGNKVTYTKDKFINFRHGYAISVHKAQGSEFDMVIIPFVNSYKRMLYNKLVYTALTRAKNKLIILGDPNAFIYGVKNDYIEGRKTGLKDIIENKYKK